VDRVDGNARPAEGLVYAVGRDVTERRLAELELERLAGEQAALRRVATLVASGGTPDEIFATVGDEVRHLVGNDPDEHVPL